MPAIVGSIKILSVGPSSIVQIGDAQQLSPYSVSKTFAGAGSFNTGNVVRTYTGVNYTNTYDGDVVDASQLSADGESEGQP